MELRLDAFDFSSLESALNTQSLGNKLFDAVVDQMTTEPAQLAITSQMNMSLPDSALSDMGSLVDVYA